MIPETWWETFTNGQRYLLVPMEDTHMALSDGRNIIPSGKKVTDASVVPVIDDFSKSNYDEIWTKLSLFENIPPYKSHNNIPSS
ncbi:MAG: hypothetical protein GQ477_03665 [Nanohaloarchaea archaeon]|nr:hypothetical protein [Candidatus Nanohaloarchaea archaeon]